MIYDDEDIELYDTKNSFSFSDKFGDMCELFHQVRLAKDPEDLAERVFNNTENDLTEVKVKNDYPTYTVLLMLDRDKNKYFLRVDKFLKDDEILKNMIYDCTCVTLYNSEDLFSPGDKFEDIEELLHQVSLAKNPKNLARRILNNTKNYLTKVKVKNDYPTHTILLVSDRDKNKYFLRVDKFLKDDQKF